MPPSAAGRDHRNAQRGHDADAPRRGNRNDHRAGCAGVRMLARGRALPRGCCNCDSVYTPKDLSGLWESHAHLRGRNANDANDHREGNRYDFHESLPYGRNVSCVHDHVFHAVCR